MKFVRAKPKNIEELEQIFNCCEEMKKATRKHAELLQDGITVCDPPTAFYPLHACPFCGTPIIERRAYKIAEGPYAGLATVINCLDLDEGEYHP